MSWMGAIPVTSDQDDPDQLREDLAAFGTDVMAAGLEHGFRVIPEPHDAETALQVCVALGAALGAARARYEQITGEESQWN